MVIAALHPTGEVGPVEFSELPQPDSITANAAHTGTRINICNLPLLEDQRVTTLSPHLVEVLHQTSTIPSGHIFVAGEEHSDHPRQ